jgi:hypothetical protein
MSVRTRKYTKSVVHQICFSLHDVTPLCEQHQDKIVLGITVKEIHQFLVVLPN